MLTIHHNAVCNPQGFFKVLGKGKLPSVPLVVKAKYFSKDVREVPWLFLLLCVFVLFVACGSMAPGV